MKSLVKICSLIAVICLAPSAKAELVTIGDSMLTHSWAQEFEENGVGSFDLIAVQMDTLGSTFETPTHTNFSDSSWGTLYENTPPIPTIASASGNDSTDLTWNINFTGSQSTPLNFDFVAFNGNNIVDSANAVWNGSGWAINSTNWAPTRASLVPEPATMALLGLGGLFFARRKK